MSAINQIHQYAEICNPQFKKTFAVFEIACIFVTKKYQSKYYNYVCIKAFWLNILKMISK